MAKRYKTNAELDAKAFDILQRLPHQVAQSFFWNHSSRQNRRDAILKFKIETHEDVVEDAYREHTC